MSTRLLETTRGEKEERKMSRDPALVVGGRRHGDGSGLLTCLAACLLATFSLLAVRLYRRRRNGEERNAYHSLEAREEGNLAEE